MPVLEFRPQDTLFFRDGRPFNQGENPFAPSMFPPSPRTMVGAARAAWARGEGWCGFGKWEDKLRNDLGGDGDQLERYSFKGPLLWRCEERLFPVPALLMGKEGESELEAPSRLMRLRPSNAAFHCDMGEAVSFPVPETRDSVEGRKAIEGWWLTRRGFASLLAGGLPEEGDLVAEGSLWREEPRVGNSIDPDTGTTREAALYATRHIRLQDGVRLVMEVNRVPAKRDLEVCVSLGGEGRFAWMKMLEDEGLDIPSAPKLRADNGKIRYAVFVLTPLNAAAPPCAGKPFAALPGRVISACMPRVQRWGGWDGIEWKPRPMRPALAPGTVLFMEAEESERSAIGKVHDTTIGDQSSWGFGLVAVGSWN